MADDVDLANDMQSTITRHKELEIRAALQHREIQPRGLCYYCDGEVGADQLFCDADCAKDYKDMQDARRRRGAL